MRNSRNNSLWIVAVMLLILGVLVYLFFASRVYNWNELYTEDDDLPYGSSLLHDILEESNTEASFIEVSDSLTNNLPLNAEKASNYVYIGRELYMNEADIDHLISFVEAGNTALMISHTFSDTFFDAVFPPNDDDEFVYEYDEYDGYYAAIERCLDRVYDSTATVSLSLTIDQIVASRYIRDQAISSKSWAFFQSDLTTIDGSYPEVLGLLNQEHPNFIKVNLGEGELYMHTTPIVFSNYQLRSAETFGYVNEVLVHLNSGTIYWDRYNRDFKWEPGDHASPPGFDHDDGMLAFILSERSMKWAWFLLLGSGFAFLIFGARRKQRPIPVMQQPTNTSVDFAETIGTMFKLENDHRKLTRLKMRLFQAHIRERYGIRTVGKTLAENTDAIERLAAKTDLHIDVITDIFATFERIQERDDPEAKLLVNFHYKLEKFYHDAR
jgi:hypothetical protein